MVADPPEFHEKLPWLFLAFALPAVVFLSVVMAPFQVADELSHCLAPLQISQGKFVSKRAGGQVDAGLVHAGHLYESMWFHAEVKQTADLARQAGAIRWQGADTWGDFCNTVQYGPVLYLPQAVGFKLGRLAGLSVAQTVVLARLINGLTACLIGFLALSICRRGRAFMFTTLLLPMTLSEIGSAAQDALIITLSLLAAALASRLLSEGRAARAGEFLLFAFIVAATTMARPTQIALVLLTPAFFSRNDSAVRRKILIGLTAAVPIIWWYSLLNRLMPSWPTGVSVSGQFEYLLRNPLALPAAILKSFDVRGKWYLGTVVGNLGWTDTPMPSWYYQVAAVATAFALISPGNRGSVVWPGLLGVGTFLGLAGLQFGALYLTWTPVAKASIDGFQGRYILPALDLLAWAAPAYGPRLKRVGDLAWVPVVVFPIITLVVLPQVIMVRYYGTGMGWRRRPGAAVSHGAFGLAAGYGSQMTT